jgi:3-methylcrotonyl-CoA carboxylase alpha subunit
MAEFRFEVAGEQFRLQLEPSAEGFRARIGDRTFLVQAQLCSNGQLDLRVDGQRYRLYSARVSDQSNQRMLWLDGQTWTVTSIDPRQRRKGQPMQHTEGAVNAAMPGQVRAILVAVGDEVSAGDPLLVLEAMKMEMRILAPQTGKIGKINCALGDVVARGQLLIEFEK